MGTVKYSGPVASFHCPTEATIRSLKVHFSPKQLGSGTPSPENVREIRGWDGVKVEQRGKNIWDEEWESGYLNTTTGLNSPTNNQIRTKNYIPLLPNTTYTVKALSKGTIWACFFDSDKTIIKDYAPSNLNRSANVYAISGKTFTTSDNCAYMRFYFTEAYGTTYNKDVMIIIGSTATSYEPYHGSTTNYEFGVLGKNKFNWDVPVSESSPVNSDAATAREFTLDTYVIGMSVNNYYRQNYANWVLNPSVENGVISFSSNAASGYGIAFPLKLAAGQTYFLSGTGDGIAGATYYDESGELILYQNNRLNKTITVPENTVTTLIGFYANTSNTDFTFSDIQLELGSTATAYEPYDPNKMVYGGWVDLISGEVCEEYVCLTLDETIPLALAYNSRQSASTRFYTSTNNVFNGAKHDTSKDCYVNIASQGAVFDETTIRWFRQGTSEFNIYLPNSLTGIISEDSDQTLYDKAHAYLSEHPINYVFALQDPRTYSLAPTQLKTFLSHNNIWSNADYVEVEYDLHETQSILARKQFIVANQPHIVKPAAAPLQNFVTDLAAPLKECKVHFSPMQEGSGDPSPENIRPISGWTGLKVYRSGKNLCDINLLAANNITISNGVATATATNFSKAFSSSFVPLNLDMSTNRWTLTMTAYTDGNSSTTDATGLLARFVYTDGTKQILYFNNQNTSPTTSSITSTVNKIPLGIQISYGSIGANVWHITNIQLEPVLEATTYEPYTGTTLPIDWASEAGTIYGGYVDLKTGEIWKTWDMLSGIWGDIRTTHSDDVGMWSGSLRSAYPFITCHSASDYNINIKSNVISEVTWNNFSVTRNHMYSGNHSSTGKGIIYLWLMDEVDPNTTIQVANRLATPELVGTLTLTQLKTLRGTNNIWSNAGDITLSYWKH